jgi:hypothetical protein
MMAEWSLGSLIVAIIAVSLSFSLSPVVLSLLRGLSRFVRNTIWPDGTLCKQLTRNEVSLRNIHICSKWTGEGLPRYSHTNTLVTNPPICEHSLPSDFFSLNAAVPPTFAKKPSDLDYGTTYLKMDTWTLGAYLLHWQDRSHWQDKVSQPRVEVKKVGDILVADVIADPQKLPLHYWPTICHLTRDDVDGILRGYPPFYRKRLLTVGGQLVRHPIRDVDDIPRGGWIAAIGLCQPFIVGKHRMKNPNLGPEESLAPLLYVIRPFKRIFEVLDNFQKAFPDVYLGYFCQMAKEIRTHKRSTTSRSEAWFYKSDLLEPFGGSRIKSQDYLRDLTAEQCQTAMDAFNNFDKPSEREVKILRPVLKKVLVAVLHGMHKAAEWDECAGILDYLDMPGLDKTTQVVYVKEEYGE